MKNMIVFSLLLFLAAGAFVEAQQKEEKQFTGFWEGKINTGALSLRMVLKTFKNEDGTTGGFLDSPDQGAKNIPVSSVAITADSLKFVINAIGASYKGEIIKDSAIAKGKFKQGGMELSLELKKVNKLTELVRPQEPQKPYPYNDQDVTFENKNANITLAGTFTCPKGDGPFPAVVLVTGSGPQDRNESLLTHKPFLVISDYLTRNGIAVLRYDDRGVAKSGGNFAAATTEDFVTDAQAAVEYLKSRKEVDPKKIGVAGHSEGGLIAPMVAVNSGDVSFIILLAGPGLPGKNILLLQGKEIGIANGGKEDEIDKAMKLNEKIYDAILSESDNAMAEKKIKAAYEEYYNSLNDEEKKDADKQKQMFAQGIQQLTSPWFRFFLKFDPRPVLENVTVPVLALNGEKDLQVPAKENLEEIDKALKIAGNKNYKIIMLPNLNHLFQTAKTGSPSEYGNIEETFSPLALRIMTEWILEVTK